MSYPPGDPIVAISADRKRAPLKVYVSYLKPHGLADESPCSIEEDEERAYCASVDTTRHILLACARGLKQGSYFRVGVDIWNEGAMAGSSLRW